MLLPYAAPDRKGDNATDFYEEGAGRREHEAFLGHVLDWQEPNIQCVCTVSYTKCIIQDCNHSQIKSVRCQLHISIKFCIYC